MSRGTFAYFCLHRRAAVSWSNVRLAYPSFSYHSLLCLRMMEKSFGGADLGSTAEEMLPPSRGELFRGHFGSIPSPLFLFVLRPQRAPGGPGPQGVGVNMKKYFFKGLQVLAYRPFFLPAFPLIKAFCGKCSSRWGFPAPGRPRAAPDGSGQVFGLHRALWGPHGPVPADPCRTGGGPLPDRGRTGGGQLGSI